MSIGGNNVEYPGRPVRLARDIERQLNRQGAAPSEVIPVTLVNDFLSRLPRATVSFRSLYADAIYDHSLAAGSQMSLGALATVPSGMVYIITNIRHRIVVPSDGLQGVPQHLEGSIAGLLSFALLFDGSDRLSAAGNVVNPYRPSGVAAAAAGGYPELGIEVGSGFGAAMALVAKPNAVVSGRLTIQNPPRFVISKAGILADAFSISEVIYSQYA